MPTKAAVLVLTPTMGLMEDGTSSTYTPGDKYSGILIAPLLKSLCPARRIARASDEDSHRRRGLRTLKSTFIMSAMVFGFSDFAAEPASASSFGFGLTWGLGSGLGGGSGFRGGSGFGD